MTQNPMAKISGATQSCRWIGKAPREMTVTSDETVLPKASAIILEDGRKKRLIAFPEGGKIRGPVRMALIEDVPENYVAASDPYTWPRMAVLLILLAASALLVVRAGPQVDDLAGLLIPLVLLMGFATKISSVRKERYTIEIAKVPPHDD